ncbi:MAG: SpoVA/SpoVAEb family sporulation membrane protein [Lachnospiraceae bacterium]|nr:SpoVA/SpoVAEb family sporulation membrane protein [Lachnospiraceae bacterium]
MKDSEKETVAGSSQEQKKEEILRELSAEDTLSQEQKKKYGDYVKQVTPTHSLPLEMLKAFITGGIICCVGQVILNVAGAQGLDKQTAGSWCSMLLILSSVILTGLNIYPGIAKWGGAGALVPITGFANSVAAPAIEFQKEGQVFGIGCKIFTIAGPVILYGIFSSWVLGVGYWILKLMGVC